VGVNFNQNANNPPMREARLGLRVIDAILAKTDGA